jgi:hypothetical protein
MVDDKTHSFLKSFKPNTDSEINNIVWKSDNHKDIEIHENYLSDATYYSACKKYYAVYDNGKYKGQVYSGAGCMEQVVNLILGAT